MENIPVSERTIAMSTIGRVGVVQPNKIKKQMAICRNCSFVMPESEYDIWKHWKYNCARKLSFKYIYPKDVTEKTKVSCLVCQQKFDNVTTSFMGEHHLQCMKEKRSNSANRSQALESPPAAKRTALSSQVVSNKRPPNNPSVCGAPPIDFGQMQFDKFKFTLAGSESYFGFKCRVCQEVFTMDTTKLLQHRTHCKIENPQPLFEPNDNNSDREVLISVQTVHTSQKTAQNANQSIPTTNTGGKPTATATPMTTAATNAKFCFVCNAASNDSFVRMFGSVSTYSKKSIFDFIWKFMDNKPSVRHETTDAPDLNDEVICSECFKMICNYDVARSHAKRLKKQIRQKLAITETYFEQINLEQIRNETDATQTMAEDGDNNQQEWSDMTNAECEVIDLCEDD